MVTKFRWTTIKRALNSLFAESENDVTQNSTTKNTPIYAFLKQIRYQPDPRHTFLLDLFSFDVT